MNKIYIAFLIAFTFAINVNAQRNFQEKQLTDDDEMLELPDDDSQWEMANKAGVIITCDSSKPLTFESNLDIEVEVFDTEEDGDKTIYYLFFDVSTERSRLLNVSSPGYYTYTLDIKSMRKTHIYRYELFDPNDAIDATKYQKYREQALQYFDECFYLEAKEQFLFASRCLDATDEQREDALAHAQDCDSIISWRRLGNEAADVLDYETALEYFSKVQALNAQDQYVTERYTSCSNAQSARSAKYMNAAEAFMLKKEYEDAIFLFQKVEALGYNNAGQAISRRIQAERQLHRNREAEHYIGYELGLSNHLMGFTYANYRNRSAGYFTLKVNGGLFELFREYNLDDQAEINVTFGWTLPVVKKINKYFQGLYMHFGPGVSVLNRFEPNTSKYFKDVADKDHITQADVLNAITDDVTSKDLLDLGISVAVTPEVGLAVKVWRFALRCTYQYRYAIDKDYESAFKKSHWSLGLGFCF